MSDRNNFKLEFERTEADSGSSFYPTELSNWIGTFNSKKWFGWPAGTWTLEALTFIPVGKKTWKIKYMFIYCGIPFYEQKKWNDTPKRDFNNLGLVKKDLCKTSLWFMKTIEDETE